MYWNCSEVPLRYRLSTRKKQGHRGELEFTNADSGMPVAESGEVITGCYDHAAYVWSSGERIAALEAEVAALRGAVAAPRLAAVPGALAALAAGQAAMAAALRDAVRRIVDVDGGAQLASAHSADSARRSSFGG